jgi:hypothetical protein
LRNGNLLIFGDNILSVTGSAFQHQSLLSNVWQFGKIWNLELGISHDWETSQEGITAAVGFWVTPEWQARLLIGPSTASELDQTQSTIFGFQIINRFDMTKYSTGTLTGSVLLDGRPATQPIAMQMEDRCVNTDSHGKFRFNHVLVGPHIVGFDIEALSATITASNLTQTVVVQQDKTVNVVFTAHTVGKVIGKVQVGPDAFGKTDPTAGVGVVISDEAGNVTTTDADNSFILGSELLGSHTITIVPSSLPPGCVVTGTSSQSVNVQAGAPAPNVIFNIAPQQQQIQMTILSH